MYNKDLPGRACLILEFEDGVKTFIEWAKGQRRHMDGDNIRIILRLLVSLKCWRSQSQLAMLRVIIHSGVMNNIWIGRRGWFLMQPGRVILLFLTKVSLMMVRGSCPVDAGTSSYVYGDSDPYNYDESRLPDHFSNIVHDADQLGAIAELVDIKADGHIFERIYDRISQWANRILPSDHTLPRDYYSAKKLVKDLGLPVEKIRACKNGCMFYWKDDVDLEYCKFCWDEVIFFEGDCRAHEVACHTSNRRGVNVRIEQSPQTDSTTMQQLDRALDGGHETNCLRLEEPRNVRLGLCTNGFTPHGQHGRTYSCWPVTITPYNLPPSMCMSSKYILLMMVIPDPSNPKHLIDVYLEPLIEELLQLWHVGVRMYDHATDRAFMIRAALMWTVNDLPAYGIASGWSTAGVMGSPVCMDDTRAFHL
ncbi:UNVERIFIED_CONTAM: hypothetical protein Scaly_2833800 [Sesamum calycinum]|uniref:Uncharacterized protein n=1 Tax=Sesamum calycinum TaxID=2727403 RepID=A0AAW2ISA5_9LAMI